MLLSQANLFGSMLNASEAQQLFNKHEAMTKELMTTPHPQQVPQPAPTPPKDEKPPMMETSEAATT